MNNESTTKRIQAAVRAGLKAASIADKTGITYFRIYSVVNPDSYRGSSVFTDKEVVEINRVLDEIKESI